MSTIQVKHDHVMMKLAKVKDSLDALHLSSPNYQSLGKNILD